MSSALAKTLKKTSDEATLRMLVEGGHSNVEIADKLEVSETTVRRRIKKAGIVRKKPLYHPALVHEPGEVTELERVQADLKEAKRVIKQYEKQDTLDDRWTNAIAQSGASPLTFKQPKLLVPKQSGKHEYTMYLKNSDAHFGELVSPAEVNGLNSYNLDIAHERHAQLWAGVIRHKQHLDGNVDVLHIEFGGDNNSGSNHKELEVTNLLPAIEQCYEWAMMVAAGILELLPYFRKIKLSGVVGNHPRFDKKPAMKQAYNNFDWAGYKFLELALSEYIDKGLIEANFPKASMLFTDLPGGKMLTLHGDGIRSSMVGVPWGGIIRRYNQLRDTFDGGFKYASFSHFHQCHTIDNRIFVNGALKGTDEFVLKAMGVKSEPRQQLLIFSNEREALVSTNYIEFDV